MSMTPLWPLSPIPPFVQRLDGNITFLQPTAALSGHLEHLAFSSAGALLLQPGLSRQIRLQFLTTRALCDCRCSRHLLWDILIMGMAPEGE